MTFKKKQEGDCMEIAFKERINHRISQMNITINKAEEKIKHMPDGRINIRKHGDLRYFYHFRKGEKERLIKQSEISLLEDLMQTCYLKKVIRSAKAEVAILKNTLKSYPDTIAEEVYESLPEERRVGVKPIVPTDDQFRERWESQTYPVKPVKEGMPVFKTLKGDLVKSKSEVLIADRLFANGIPYKYECPINVGGIIFHPDFTILRMSDRKILYLEHCGKVGDAEYAEDMVSRANRYSLAGIMQGDSLFFTFETSKTPLDTEVIDKMIENCFR